MVKYLKSLKIGIDIGHDLKISVLLYADDIILLGSDEAELQSLLLALQSWCNMWELKVNIEKSNVIHFRNPRRQRTNFTFKYNESEILKVSNYKYLGFYLHEHMDYEYNANRLCDSASRALGSLNSKFKSLKNVSFNAYSKIFHSGVASILDYSSEIWGFIKAPSIDKIQNRAMRFLLGVHKFCPLPALSGDIGWLPCRYRRYISIIRYWNRLIQMNNERLTKKVFLHDYDQNSNNSWSNDVENIFDSVNLLTHYENKSVCNISKLESNVKILNQNVWYEHIHCLPKLRTYILFKSEYCTENYLKLYLSCSQRSLLAQLRTGILPLKLKLADIKIF